ncbi:MAG: succinate dehydrogenase/fumarate reductase flavoprotein subunit [Alphaproteobacteria bacterium]|nr:succinate dehydrogenase/fumarate reductase flavoprotein subunit [Alphaproteobacteria bacterium]
MQSLTCDILIIGGGGAALFAAIHARDSAPNLDIVVASKGLFAKSGCTRMVQGGYNVVLHDDDSFDKHYDDTIRGGSLINNQELAWTLVTQAPERVFEMENSFGCTFDRNADGTIHQRALAGQSFNRTIHRGDLTGIEIISRLAEQMLVRDIEMLNEVRGVDLLLDGSGQSVTGALLMDQHSGELIAVNAAAVLVATGGAAPLYRITAASLEKSGDGLAMAYRAGAEFVDMEMMQFHPTGLIVDGSLLNGTVLEEGLRGAGGHLLNADHERYMERYDPEKMERSTRDRVSRSGMMEIRAGRGTDSEGVYLDVRHLGKEFLLKSSPGMYERCLTVGTDMETDLIEVTPTAHFQMGGIRIDSECRTSLAGLFAAGEDAGGVHGANRLGGNGVAESMVFGAIAGESMARHVKESARPAIDPDLLSRLCDRLEGSAEITGEPYRLKNKLRALSWEHLGILREANGLARVEEELNAIESELTALPMPAQRGGNPDLQERLDAENLIDVARLIGAAASQREESRGSHFREDFPDSDDRYLVNFFQRKEADGSMTTESRPVEFSRRTPDALLGETLIPA